MSTSQRNATILTRRQFLVQGALAGLGLGLASCSGLRQRADDAPPTPMARASPTPLLSATPTLPSPSPTPIQLHEAMFYETLPDGRVRRQVCFRQCVVPEGQLGFCRNKQNIGGKYYTRDYARPGALQIDPIEKEPAFHMLPGGTIFCTGTASCNNRCKFCQNSVAGAAHADSHPGGGKHLEVVNLVVPTLNDELNEEDDDAMIQ